MNPDRPDWMSDGACVGANPELFFPTRGEQVDGAKAVCRTCPVTRLCLEYALDNNETYGIWGGRSERERRRMRRGHPTTPKLRPIEHGTTAGHRAHQLRGEEPCWACRDARNRYMEAVRSSRAKEPA